MDFQLGDHVLIFISLLYAYIVTVFLAGWARMLQNRNEHKVSLLHLGWTILFSILIIQTWWSIVRYLEKTTLNIGFFMLMLLPLGFLFFTGFYLFPEREVIDKSKNYENYYFASRKLIFFSAIGYLLCMIVIAPLYKGTPFFHSENLIRVTAIAVLLLLIFTKNKLVHYSILVLAVALLVFFIMQFSWVALVG